MNLKRNGEEFGRQQNSDDVSIPKLSKVTQRKLIAKIDWRVMPCLSGIFFLSFIDKVNIANGAVFNLVEDLRLTGTEYNNCLVIFFVFYWFFQIPGNILMKRFRPRIWLSAMIFLFGFSSMCQGFASGYAGIITARVFLGIFESMTVPGCLYLISMWYKRSQAQRRYTFFYCSASFAGAFGGLLASAIGLMDGFQGYAGWRWIFIIEGACTCLLAIPLFWIIPEFPERAKWLSERERDHIIVSLQEDIGPAAADLPISFRDIFNVLKDLKVIIAGLMYLACIVPAYAYAYFAPTIILAYGYSPIETQLHSVPPWACAFGVSMLAAWLSDYLRHRFFFVVGSILVAIAGFITLLVVHDDTHAEYAALFLIVTGIYTSLPVQTCWFNMNISGHRRKTVALAFQLGVGQLGGVIAVYLFLAEDAPRYTLGYSVALAFAILSMALASGYAVLCLLQNKARDQIPDNALTYSEKEELGDLSPSFRFML